jgi:hypothetical protein
MPYIKDRDGFTTEHVRQPQNVGELNYVITETLWEFYKKTPCYQQVNNIVGALECAKLEFYRRVAAPYEDEAIVRNGDVYVDF